MGTIETYGTMFTAMNNDVFLLKVYGFDEESSDHLRGVGHSRHLLRSTIRRQDQKEMLPFNDRPGMDCRGIPFSVTAGCFLAGDVRANEQLGLTAMHTIWMREHNRIAQMFGLFNPHWDSDVIYHEARKLVSSVTH